MFKKLNLNGKIHVFFQFYAIRAFLGNESNVFVDISKSNFQKIKFDLSMDSYSHMYYFGSIFTVNIVLYPL